MKTKSSDNESKTKFTRRDFLNTVSVTSAGLFFAPFIKTNNVFAYGYKNAAFLAKVAITKADNYERAFIKQKVQYLFESINGIGDVVKAGNKVGIKINLTGGSGSNGDAKLGGKSLTETMWTHPEVVRAVGELLIDGGINAGDIYIVESLWDDASFNNFGYEDVRKSLGAKKIDLNKPAPYAAFTTRQVGPKKISFTEFTMNQILSDIDVYVSIPKMKQHATAGVTHSLKISVGAVPKQLYTTPHNTSMRNALHTKDETMAPGIQLPHSICDLNNARPVNLAIIDGIKNAKGGEGTWNPSFQVTENHVLIAGKDPVATDSVASFLMGNNPEAAKLKLPDGGECENYLEILHQQGMGTNQMKEIEVVGDGADLLTSAPRDAQVRMPNDIQLCQNYPNPFNPSTMIRFYVPAAEYVSVKIYNIAGQEIETLIDGNVPAGLHEFHWSAQNLASGAYLCRMQAGTFSDTKKLIYQK
jgi:uncharacterized protein (DUF362 family)